MTRTSATSQHLTAAILDLDYGDEQERLRYYEAYAVMVHVMLISLPVAGAVVVAVAGASATAPVLVMLLAGFAPVFAGMAHLRRQQVRLELIAMSGRNRWFAISYLIAVAALVVALAVRSGVSGWGTVLGAAVGAGLALGVIAARYRQQRHADAAEAESSDQNDER